MQVTVLQWRMPDEVKEAANFVAPSYKEDGVLQVLKAVLSGELC